MKNIAKVTIIGNLVKDPLYDEVSKRCTMTIAVNRQFTSNGIKKEEANFFKVLAWDKLGELCHSMLKRGSTIYVEGRLHNFQSGDRVETEIIMNEMIDFRRKETVNDPEATIVTEKSPDQVQVPEVQ